MLRRAWQDHPRRRAARLFRVRADLRHQTQTTPVRSAQSPGMAANQQVTFLTDGGEDIRDLPCYLNAQAKHLLDWFHLTMRITVMANMAKSLQPPPPDPQRPDTPPAPTRPAAAGEVVLLAWQRLPRPAKYRRPDLRSRHHRALPGAGPAAQGGPRVRQLQYIRANAGGSPTTGNATARVRPSPPRSPSPRSTRSSASAW